MLIFWGEFVTITNIFGWETEIIESEKKFFSVLIHEPGMSCLACSYQILKLRFFIYIFWRIWHGLLEIAYDDINIFCININKLLLNYNICQWNDLSITFSYFFFLSFNPLTTEFRFPSTFLR